MLRDCISADRSISELLIMRPDRFGRMAKDARDRFTQALFLLNVLPIDVNTASLDEALDDRGVREMIAAFGVGIYVEGSMWNVFQLEFLRFETIVLVRDDSPKGRLAYERVLSVFTRFMAPMLVAGHVYSVDLPANLNEAEFERTVMSPATRRLVPIR